MKAAAQSFSILKLLLPGRVAHDPTKAVQQSACEDRIRASILYDRAWETVLAASTEGSSVFVVLYFEAIMCVLPMQTDSEGVRKIRGCGDFGGGGIAADARRQMSNRPTYSVSSGSMRKSASALPTVSEDWTGVVLMVWWFGGSVSTNETDATARHEPRRAAVDGR
jgi:hypothetical protein